MKTELTADGTLMFWCPGCETHHGPLVNGTRGWTWTAIGSVRRFSRRFYVTDGRIRFLNDCTHSLAGQTVRPTGDAMMHDWFQPTRQQAGYPWTICRICGVVQRRDGKNKPCKGPTRLRDMDCLPITDRHYNRQRGGDLDGR